MFPALERSLIFRGIEPKETFIYIYILKMLKYKDHKVISIVIEIWVSE